MIFVHLALLVLGAVLAVAAIDVLGHRGIGSWPAGLAAGALVVVGALLYSAEVSAFALGAAIGVAGAFGVGRALDFRDTRRRYRAASRARAERDAHLEKAARGREGL